MNAKCLVRLCHSGVVRPPYPKSWLPAIFLHSKKRPHNVQQPISPYEEFSPDFQFSLQDEEMTSHSENTLPKTLSKKELYIQACEEVNAKKSGCAPSKRALTLVRGVLHARSLLKTSLSDRSVTLFNFHTTDFAEKLLQSNIGSLVIVESDRNYARAAKAFARTQRAQSRNVAAYRTELGTLLGISRKKVSGFPSHLLSAQSEVPRNPFALTSTDPQDESGNPFSRSPILASTLPTVLQQTSVLEALLNNLLLHYSGIDEETIYAYGQIELITFLSAFTLSHLLAGVDPRLSFLSHSYRRRSELFFKLFDIELLRVEGYSRRSFIPAICVPKRIPHEKKLKELNIINGLLYATAIRPIRCITLGDVDIGAHNDRGSTLDARCLLPFAYWLNLIGKQQASKKTKKVLEELGFESTSVALQKIDGKRSIGQTSTDDLEQAFIAVREELEQTNGFQKYREMIISRRSA